MTQTVESPIIYYCPMHSDVREATAGTCPHCGMDLLPEGTKFAMLRMMMKSARMLTLLGMIGLAIAAAIVTVR